MAKEHLVRWYRDRLQRVNLDSGEHFVVYDDGKDEQDEDLRVMKFRFIKDGANAIRGPAHPEDPWFCAHCDFSSP